jgi:spore germination protein KA
MLLMFELLRESGTRLPRPIGSAISIVRRPHHRRNGREKGDRRRAPVIILALTAVSSFINPTLTEFMTVYRFFFWFMGSFMGIIGVSLGIVVMLTHVVSSTSFGVPVLSSFSGQE